MSAQPKPNEPSMEEILASIRRIIADDDGKAVPDPAPAPAAAEVPVPEPTGAVVVPLPLPDVDEDILDLSAEATLVPPEPAAADADAPVFAPVDDVDFADPPAAGAMPAEPPVAESPVAEPAAAEPAAAEPVPPGAGQRDMASLLSDHASAAVHDAFGQLAHTVLSGNARTLEDLVKDMLKPMLKTWLDDNLPGMVERLVRAEIERVARGGRR